MHFQKLYTDIFNASAADTENVSMLRKVADDYPYFSLAHFFLLKQAIETGQDIENIASKTALHFNNPFLLNEQLHRAPIQNNGFENPPTLPEQDILKAPVPGLAEEKLPGSIITLEVVPEIPIALPEQEMVRETVLAEESIIPGSIHPLDEVQATPPEPAQEVVEPAVTAELPANNAPANDNAGVSEEVKQKEEAPIFEPLFASDYFASQGIKITDEQQPTDRMGKQLKSFTEWLKTMKKVHDTKQATGEASVDITVQNLAEKSNKEEEVLTEAMAEVFLQQGKTNKAKEIYEKLSLLNPSKSAYFAAKLEQIK
jgi:hypothetical protein